MPAPPAKTIYSWPTPGLDGKLTRGRSTRTNPPKGEDGFALAVSLVAAGILFAGSLGLAVAGAAAREGAARQYQARQAQEAAEAGLAVTLEKLNGTYRYLLVNNLSDWGSTALLGTQICPNAATNFGSMPKSGAITDSSSNSFGQYIVSDYTFTGNPYYGGTGTIKITGTALSSGRVLATSILTATLQVVPKNCGGTITTPPTSSGFPGLLGNTVDLGNNDVLGVINGNILCMSCDGTTQEALATQINKKTQSIVNGTLFGGTIPLPPIPAPPSNLNTNGLSITSTATVRSGTSGNDDDEEDGTGYCVLSNGVTYCRISNINLSGSSTLTFDTTSSPMRVYVEGSVTLLGQSKIVHTGSPERLAIFGNAADSTASTDQTFSVAGGSTATNAFIYMPDGCVGIKGGSSSPDFNGAIWAKSYGSCGSSSNNGDMRVPDGMGGLLTDTLGDTFNVSIRDFAAAGIKSWSVSTGN